MIDQSHPRQSLRTAHRVDIAGRRCFLFLLAFGVAIEAWALYPSTVDSNTHVPPPQASAPAVAKSARGGVVGGPLELTSANAFRLIDDALMSPNRVRYGLATVGYSSPMVTVSQVPLRSKLQALLMLLYSQSGGVDPAALEAKLQALLQLPDSALAQLMAHPDLAALNELLDAVFLGTSDLSGVETELHKIDVVTVQGTSEQIRVIKVNGKSSYTVHLPPVDNQAATLSVSPVPAPPPPPPPPPPPLAEPTMMMAAQLEMPAGPTASTFMLAPSSEQLAPPPAPVALSAPAFTATPSSEEMAPPPAPTPTTEASRPSEEPTATPQTSLDVINSGNRFEPGETVAQPSTDNSPATQTESPATQTATPSTHATGAESPSEAVGGGDNSPSNNDGDTSSSNGGTTP